MNILSLIKDHYLIVIFVALATVGIGTASFVYVANLSTSQKVGDDSQVADGSFLPDWLVKLADKPTEAIVPPDVTTPTPDGTTPATPNSTTPAPTPTTPETPAPTPSTPSPGETVSCALPKYPNPACTGVPAGTVLTTITGDYTANTPGEVVNAKRITGNLYIGAEGITVTNSQIDGTIYNNQALDHFSFTVTDTTIGPETGCIGQPGINDSRYTARRVEIRGHDDGFRVGTPGEVAIYDSYAKLCYLTPDVAPPDGSHSDGVQAYCPGGICSGLIVDHNTFDSRGIIATFMLNLAYDQLRNVTATNNMLAGGPYVLVAKWFGGPNYEIHNNRIVDQSWIYAPVSGEGTCANQNWSGNSIVTIDDNYAITSTVRSQDCQY